MSTYQSTPYQQTPPTYHTSVAPARPPAVLVAAVGAAIGAAVLMSIGAVVVLAGVLDAAMQQVADNPTFGGDKMDVSRVDPNSDRVRGLVTIFKVVSYDTIFWALVLAVLAYFALRGGRTTRILSTVILVVSEVVLAANLWFSYPMLAKATGGLASVLALAAIVLFFLPASNAYGKSRRAAKAAGQR
jgi:hypothetical protein